jgi:acetoin utilization deacetylase AcuC-like enzyme
MKVGSVYHSIYLKHNTGQHIENASRLEAIGSYLKQSGLNRQLVFIEPRAASIKQVASVHNEQYISVIKAIAQEGGGWLDADTVMSPNSYEAAMYAAGGGISATEAVMNGEVDSAFALVRPPGHHATPERGMGFCLFNNVAISAKYALDEYGLERILIIDFDVHHGNGTQDVFFNDPTVLYISIHQLPLYPGTGNLTEIGNGAGEGATINIPLLAGGGDAEYQQVFDQIVVPAARRFNPRIIMVSAGYDLHWLDSISSMQVSTSGIARIVKMIRELADELCRGRLVFLLEGGYHLRALESSVKATFDMLLGNTDIEDPLGQSPRRFAMSGFTSLVEEIKTKHNLI